MSESDTNSSYDEPIARLVIPDYAPDGDAKAMIEAIDKLGFDTEPEPLSRSDRDVFGPRDEPSHVFVSRLQLATLLDYVGEDIDHAGRPVPREVEGAHEALTETLEDQP
mgnify:CR=1 FL=1